MGGKPKLQAPPPAPTVSGVELPSEQKQQQTQDYLKQTQELTTNTLFAGKDTSNDTSPDNPEAKKPTPTKKRGLLGLYQ